MTRRSSISPFFTTYVTHSFSGVGAGSCTGAGRATGNDTECGAGTATGRDGGWGAEGAEDAGAGVATGSGTEGGGADGAVADGVGSAGASDATGEGDVDENDSTNRNAAWTATLTTTPKIQNLPFIGVNYIINAVSQLTTTDDFAIISPIYMKMTNTRRTLAVGWFDNAPFTDVCSKYLPRIREVFFAWPGVKASRPMDDWTDERKARIIADLKWARANGIELDTIFNANCYGDIALSDELADHVTEKLREMDAAGLFPEHLTTTSPFIATVVRQRFPSVKIRLSVNTYITTENALRYVDELYDSFYIGLADHRRIENVRRLSAWARQHGKSVGMYVNSGCLRNCPFHQFHDNLHGHNRVRQSAAGEKFGFSVFRCRTNYERGNYEDFLRGLWIRPEDLPLYEPYVDVIKVATRRHPNPEAIIRAYASYSYDGDLTAISDPFFRFPMTIDNAVLGASPLWPEVRDCQDADNCRRCGRCTKLLEELAHAGRASQPALTEAFKGFFKG